jgi:hypothetical protein
MAFDPSQVTPGGKTSVQIDAEMAEYVRAANAALASARDKDACWSVYYPSHSTFEVLVGEPDAEDNILLSMPACEYVAGPVRWPAQHIEIVWHCDRERVGEARRYELQDGAAGFRAVGLMFRWARGLDPRVGGGLWFGRGSAPPDPLNYEQAQGALTAELRRFYRGLMRCDSLYFRALDILAMLPGERTPPARPSDRPRG